MAKFAAVQTNSFADSNQDELKNFTCIDLKKKFKCKKVFEVKDYRFKNTKVAEFSQISEYEIDNLSKQLRSIDLRNFSDIKYRKHKNTKLFIFSDDASSSAFVFDVLKDNCIIKLFELNEENIDDFAQSIETIKSSDEQINSLNEAKTLCESLTNIEHDLNISLVSYSAIDDIDEKISEIEDELESSKETVEEFFSSQWN